MIKTSLLFFIAITITFLPGQNEPYELMPTRVFTEEKHGIYFKSLPFVDSNASYLFISNNLHHIVWRLDLEKENLEQIGQKGEGPGDYYQPTNIATDGNIVALIHNRGISFFESNSKQYLHSFRTFLSPFSESLALTANSLFLFTSKIKNSIIEYSLSGKKLLEFGEPIMVSPDQFMFEDIKGFKTFASTVNQFFITPFDNKVYVLNRYLLSIKEYDRRGHLKSLFFLNEEINNSFKSEMDAVSQYAFSLIN